MNQAVGAGRVPEAAMRQRIAGHGADPFETVGSGILHALLFAEGLHDQTRGFTPVRVEA